jgi:predicted GNAT family acetyltransferase
MHQSTAIARKVIPVWAPAATERPVVSALTNDSQTEVLGFLSRRPIHNAGMIGFILDNGLVSELNRGTFYACRNWTGQLEGVALIGHATLMESQTDRALEAFAGLARTCASKHLIMGEQEQIERFWNYYYDEEYRMRHTCRENLFQLTWPVQVHEEVPGLRLATSGDIELLMPIHARMAFEESGIDPLKSDPSGFRERCVRRIERNRTWVWTEDGRVIFKADVVADTSDVAYLEGVWVAEERRNSGYGVRCISQLSRKLLQQTKSICLLVNDNNRPAQALYERAGFTRIALFDTVFI